MLRSHLLPLFSEVIWRTGKIAEHERILTVGWLNGICINRDFPCLSINQTFKYHSLISDNSELITKIWRIAILLSPSSQVPSSYASFRMDLGLKGQILVYWKPFVVFVRIDALLYAYIYSRYSSAWMLSHPYSTDWKKPTSRGYNSIL